MAVALTSTSDDAPASAQSSSAAQGRLTMTHAGLGRVRTTLSTAPVNVTEHPAATGAIQRAPGMRVPCQGATSAGRPIQAAGAAFGAPPSGVGRASASAKPRVRGREPGIRESGPGRSGHARRLAPPRVSRASTGGPSGAPSTRRGSRAS
eukprot:2737211-Alexandrium_andersonii.AAC.1